MFICEEEGPSSKKICVPHCPDWNVFPYRASLTQDVLVGMTALIGAIAAAVVIVVTEKESVNNGPQYHIVEYYQNHRAFN